MIWNIHHRTKGVTVKGKFKMFFNLQLAPYYIKCFKNCCLKIGLVFIKPLFLEVLCKYSINRYLVSCLLELATTKENTATLNSGYMIQQNLIMTTSKTSMDCWHDSASDLQNHTDLIHSSTRYSVNQPHFWTHTVSPQGNFSFAIFLHLNTT